MHIHYSIKDDGSFDLSIDKETVFEDCYPEINGRSVRTKQVIQGKNGIRLILDFMELSLYFEPRKEALLIRFTASKCNIHYHDIGLNGRLSKAPGGIYCSAGQMGEECGYSPVQKLQGIADKKSSGLMGIQFNNYSLLAFVADHTRWHQEFHYRNNFENVISLTVQFRTENMNHETDTFPPIYIMKFHSLNDGLKSSAEIIGASMKARRRMPPAYHWCSWYYNYSEFNENQLNEYLDGFEGVAGHEDIQYVQIDAGNCKELGDWLEPRSYWPSGLDYAVSRIKEAGYAPGIWIGPFMVGNHSRLAKKHPEWLLRDSNGQLCIGMCTDNEPRLWGYHDEEYYILDSSHPEAFAYLRQVFHTMKSWGVKMFKTDFMLWGYQDSSLVRRAVPGKTSVEYFRDVLQMIREEIGEEDYWLGCIAPFYPFIGFADGMRIGGDVGSSWDGEFGPQNMIHSVEGNYYMNFSYFQNDPDAVMLRDFHIRLNEREIYSLALYQCLSGGCVYTSEPLHMISSERRKLWRFIKPRLDRHPVPYFPFMEEERTEKVIVYHGEDGRGVIYIFNPSNSPITGRYPLSAMGFSNCIYITEEETDSTEIREDLISTVASHDHRLYAVSSSPHPFNYSNIWDIIG